MIRRAILLLSCVGLVGCRSTSAFDGRNLAAAESLSIVKDDCLGTSGEMLSVILPADNSASRDGEDEPKKKRRLACAAQLENFQKVYVSKAEDKKTSRNEIIDAIIAESNAKCTAYSRKLKNVDALMNGSLGVMALITGGLGAFVGGAGAAKALSGTSAIITGTRAELNETVLNNQTIQLLATSFEVARSRKLQEITNLQACPMDQYSVMRGIADAVDYHRECSLLVGLAEATRSVERSNNPGVDALRQQLQGLSALRVQAVQFGSTSQPAIAQLVAGGNLSILKSQDDKVKSTLLAYDNAKSALQPLADRLKDLSDKLEVLKKGTPDPDNSSITIPANPDKISDKEGEIKITETELNNAKNAIDGAKLEYDQARTLYEGMLAVTGSRAIAMDSGALKTRQCPFGEVASK